MNKILPSVVLAIAVAGVSIYLYNWQPVARNTFLQQVAIPKVQLNESSAVTKDHLDKKPAPPPGAAYIPNEVKPIFSELRLLGIELSPSETQIIIDLHRERLSLGKRIIDILQTAQDQDLIVHEAEIYRQSVAEIEEEFLMRLGPEKTDALKFAAERSKIREDINSLAAFCGTHGLYISSERKQILLESLHSQYKRNEVAIFYNTDSAFISREKFRDFIRSRQTADSHALQAVRSHFSGAELKVMREYFDVVQQGLISGYESKRRRFNAH